MLQLSEAKIRAAMQAYQEESLDYFRESTGLKDIPLHCFYVFLLIPNKGPVSVDSLKKSLKNLSQAALSRNLSILTGKSKLRKDGGVDLVEDEEDTQDRRFKVYKLSPKGREVRESMHQRGWKHVSRILGLDEEGE